MFGRSIGKVGEGFTFLRGGGEGNVGIAARFHVRRRVDARVKVYTRCTTDTRTWAIYEVAGAHARSAEPPLPAPQRLPPTTNVLRAASTPHTP